MELTLCGVPGTLVSVPRDDKLFKMQRWTSERRKGLDERGDIILIHAEVRFDDECGNGHNSFAVTGYGWYGRYKAKDWDFGGCCHDNIAKMFPELAHLIKWHHASSDGPMYYIANTVYHAGDRDHRGLRKGEPYAWSHGVQFGNSPITVKLGDRFAKWLEAAKVEDLEIVEVPYKDNSGSGHKFSPKYSFKDYGNGVWHESPFDTLREAEEFLEAMDLPHNFVKVPTLFSEGKERDLDAARRVACWPEATDEQLCLPPGQLTALLSERQPALLKAFRHDIEAAGLKWQPGA